MSNFKLYLPLLEKAVTILHLEEIINDANQTKKEKRKASDILNELRPELISDSQKLISNSFDNWQEKSGLISHIIYELDELKSVADSSWHAAIAKLKELLVEQTIKESKKSSFRRKIEKHSWWIILVTISISALSIRYYSAVEVTDKITEKSGIIQRGDALQKILRYDDWMDTKVRKGGWLKSFLLWPIEPTKEEINYAAEFIGATEEIYGHLLGQSIICNVPTSYNTDHMTASKDVLDFIQEKSNIFKIDQTENSVELIAIPFIEKFPCSK
jgi:hypothetical protein